MTTVIDPAGTPAPVYNKSGKTILPSLQGGAQSGGGFPSPIGNVGTPISSFSETTVVSALCNSTGYVFTLPSGADIGDVVMVYADPSSTHGGAVFGANGESIANLPTSTGTNSAAAFGFDSTHGVVFVKVSSASWQPF